MKRCVFKVDRDKARVSIYGAQDDDSEYQTIQGDPMRSFSIHAFMVCLTPGAPTETGLTHFLVAAEMVPVGSDSHFPMFRPPPE